MRRKPGRGGSRAGGVETGGRRTRSVCLAAMGQHQPGAARIDVAAVYEVALMRRSEQGIDGFADAKRYQVSAFQHGAEDGGYRNRAAFDENGRLVRPTLGFECVEGIVKGLMKGDRGMALVKIMQNFRHGCLIVSSELSRRVDGTVSSLHLGKDICTQGNIRQGVNRAKLSAFRPHSRAQSGAGGDVANSVAAGAKRRQKKKGRIAQGDKRPARKTAQERGLVFCGS